MPLTKVERVRGASDVLPDDYVQRKRLEDTLRSCFEAFGYRPLEAPVIEYTDLYLKKSGEDIVARLYDFTYQNRRLCLRPEMTASVVRAYVDSLQESPLPVRLYHVGPVFRYEKPQRGRYRQFTQIGIELIGAAGPMADAEVIYVASKGLVQLELTGYRIVIGHIGILAEFLRSLELEGRLQNFLLANMETLRRENKEEVLHRIRAIYPAFQAQISETSLTHDSAADHEARMTKKLSELLGNMEETEARMVIHDLLESMNIELDGNRSPDEIIDRLLIKMRRQDQTPRLNQALAFMSELGQLAGEPSEVLPEAEKLLTAHSMSRAPLEQLRGMIETLKHYPVEWSRVTLDFGLSRGLQYYTGMIFEIHHGARGEDRQLCGGGRYDDLVMTFGGKRETPAAGFSYGLERILLGLQSEGKPTGLDCETARILVIPVSAEDRAYAIAVAERLRCEGLSVEMDVRGRSVKSNFQYADKQGMRFAIVAGTEERRASEVLLKHMASRQEQRVTINDAITQINQMRKQNA